MVQYELSQSLVTDADPVRSLTSTKSSIIAGSESGRISSIARSIGSSSPNALTADKNGIEVQPGGEGTQHSHHITALINTPDDGYVTGCKDKLIRVFGSDHQLLHTLPGHENAVTSLSWLEMPSIDQPLLISGSWDGTAKLWNLQTGQCLATLPGHENTVSVQGLPPIDDKGRIATGSAGVANGSNIIDHKIRIWDVTGADGSNVQVQLKTTVANDHDGPIRGLAYDAATQMLLSCSNDGTVKVRDVVTAEAVTTLTFPYQSQQAPMLLNVTSMADRKIVACSEDGNVVIWNMAATSHENSTQVIIHPNCVWSILALDNCDIVTACHDGIIRIFTADEQKEASDAEKAAFHDAVMESKAKSSSGPSAEEIASLPKWEMNASQIGRSEGQVQVFNKNGKAIAAQWSAASATWIEVGEVTGSNQNAGTVNGVSYDHVFPIEVDVPGGGVQNLQIGYNNGENPFTTAQAFIDEHMLDQGYLAQIADYIRSRAGEGAAPTLGMSDAGSSSTAPVPMDIAPSAPPTPTYKHLPMKGYTSFETGADGKVLAKVSKKIREFNSCLNNNNLSPDEASTLLDTLCGTVASTNRYHATKISDMELAIVLKMIKDWSLENVFPSIDLARLAVLHPDASQSSRVGLWENIITAAMDRCSDIQSSGLEGTPRTAIPMLSMRLLANCFKGGAGSQAVAENNLNRILKCVGSFATSTNKNTRLALASVLLNVSSYMKSAGRATGDDTTPELFLITIGNICGSGLYETEAIVRVLIALGTSLLVSDSFKKKANDLNMTSMLQHVASHHGEKAASIVAEIRTILVGS